MKNCILSGSTGVTAIAGVLSGSGVTFGGAAEAPNSNNTIQNHLIFRTQNAAFLSGNAASLDQNWLVTGNTFGSTVAADKHIFRGMLIGNAQNFVVSHNTINGVVSTATSSATMSGIQLASSLNGGSVFQNRISDIKQTNTLGYGSHGIYSTATTTASDVSIFNNFVYDVASYAMRSPCRRTGRTSRAARTASRRGSSRRRSRSCPAGAGPRVCATSRARRSWC